MRYVFVTDELPRPGSAGHLALNHAICEWLRGAGHEVEILLVKPRLRLPVELYEHGPVSGPGLLMWGRHIIASAPRNICRILARYLLGKMPPMLAVNLRRRKRLHTYGPVDAILGVFITPGQAAWCAARIETLKPDTVLIDTIFRADVLKQPPLSGIHSLIVAHDVFHLRHRALAAAAYNIVPASLSREIEAGYLNLACAIAAIQPEEAAVIRGMCPDRQVCVAPMPAMPSPRPAGMARLPDRLVFVGSDSLPNLDGLRWFFSEIWLRLRAWRPSITLDLVGDCADGFSSLPKGVNRLGRVKDLAPVLHRASLAISPLRAGSGLKIKLLDYARHGLITVATPSSLQGFAQDNHAPFVSAADAASFMAVIASRLKTPASAAVEAQIIAYVVKYYGIQSSFAGLAASLRIPPQPDPQTASQSAVQRLN